METIPDGACMSRETVESLTKVLAQTGFKYVSFRSMDKNALHLNAMSSDDMISIKVRREQKESKQQFDMKSHRELEALIIAAQRFVRTKKATPYLVPTRCFQSGKWGTAAQIKLGNQFFYALCMDHIVADSTFALQWVQTYRAGHSGDCPDDVREFAAQVLQALSFLHERCMSLNGFGLSSIGFLPGFNLHPVFTDLAGAVVGKRGRQYSNFEAKPDPLIDACSDLTPSSVKVVDKKQVETILNSRGSLALLSPTELKKPLPSLYPVKIHGPCRDAGDYVTEALENCRYADLESVSKVVVQLITGVGEQDIESLLERLKQAQSTEDFAAALGWPINQQRTTMPRFLRGIQNLMSIDPERRKSAAAAQVSKPFQFVILSEKLTNESLNDGIPVPAGPTVPDKYTQKSRMAPRLAIVQAQNTGDNKKKEKQGLCVKAKQAIRKNQFITDYAGEYALHPTSPSLHAFGIRHNYSSLKACFNSQLTLDVYIRERAVGHLLSSSRDKHDKRKPGNVYPDRSEMYIDANGNLKVPMKAIRDILEDEELVWDYDYKALACGSLVECSSDEDEDEDCGLSAAGGVAKGRSPTEKSVESNKQPKDSFRTVNDAYPKVLEPYFCTSSMYF